MYPQILKNIYDPPKELYVLGDLENLNRKCVSIVGTRNASKESEKMARIVAYKFAKKGFVIVSGLAKGIDQNAHIGALLAGGRTIAVLGHGLNMIYPKSNTNLAKEIIKNKGTLITEYSIFDEIKKTNFVNRNRIISGLSVATIVIEAKRISGSLITADFALEQGRDVYAVPGSITNINKEGCNALIQDGAYPLTLDNIKETLSKLS